MSSLKSREEDGVLIVNFTDAKILDEARIQQIGTELMEMVVAASQNKKMLLNFHGVQFMSSAMIGKLVLLNKKAKDFRNRAEVLQYLAERSRSLQDHPFEQGLQDSCRRREGVEGICRRRWLVRQVATAKREKRLEAAVCARS